MLRVAGTDSGLPITVIAALALAGASIAGSRPARSSAGDVSRHRRREVRNLELPAITRRIGTVCLEVDRLGGPLDASALRPCSCSPDHQPSQETAIRLAPVALSICCVTARASRAAAVPGSFARSPTRSWSRSTVWGRARSHAARQGSRPSVRDRARNLSESAMAWIHAQCSGRLDHAYRRRRGRRCEPARAASRAHPGARRSPVLVSAALALPRPRHWLDEWPWFPDFQGRLVRNDAQLWFPGLCHSSVAPTLPARYLDSGLYHLVLQQPDRQERERKVERYRKSTRRFA